MKMYSIESSRRSRLNYQAAEAARKLAEFTRKDSMDTRVITALTSIFFPTTFAAVNKSCFCLFEVEVELADFRVCSALPYSTSVLETPIALFHTGFACM